MVDKDTLEAKNIYEEYGDLCEKILRKDIERQNLFKIFHSLIGNVKNKKILDAGCGFGEDAKKLAKKGARVFCVDISTRMIELARKNCKGLNVNFYTQDMEKISFKIKFDKIIAVNSIMYKKNLKNVLKTFKKLLKKDGEILIVVPHPVRKMIKYTKNYFESGKHWENYQGIKWFGYYRTMSEYINTAISCGLKIKEIVETRPKTNDSEFCYPRFLIMRLCVD
jgi:SAM-dependent methyltransferase